MKPEIQKAVDALNEELKTILSRAGEIKKMVNQLFVFDGEVPPYTDVDAGMTISASVSNIQHDTFFGKGLSTAVKDFLRMKGRAATSQEIFEALNRGGFKYPAEWKENLRLKNLAISIGKNSADFVRVETTAGTAFGLWEFYPEMKREKEKKKTGREKTDPAQVSSSGASEGSSGDDN